MKEFLKNHWEKIIISLFFGFFLYQTIYFLENTIFNLPPDEKFHFEHIKQYKEANLSTFFIPKEEWSADHGSINQSRFLYYSILGKIAHFVPEQWNLLTILRGLNVLITTIYLFVFYKLGKLLFPFQKLSQVVAFGIQTNLLMFVFLGASVSYDNFVNLLAIGSIYYLICFFKNQNIKSLLLFLILNGLGVLTKITFWPLTFLSVLGLIFWSIYKKLNKQKLLKKKYISLFLGSLTFVVVSFSIIFFINNLWTYRSLFPKCPTLYSHEQCLAENGIYRRNLSLEEKAKNENKISLNPISYSGQWLLLSKNKILGIVGGKTLSPNSLYSSLCTVLIFIWSIFFIRNFNHKKSSSENILWFIFSGYLLILMFLVNYKLYQRFGRIHIGLQGRYMFPVLFIFIFYFTHYLINYFSKNKIIKSIISIIILIVFILNGFYHYITSSSKLLFENKLFSNQIGWIGMINGNSTFKQIFFSSKNNLSGIQVIAGTYGIKNFKTSYKLEIKNKQNKKIREIIIPSTSIKDGKLFSIKFPPIKNSKEQIYSFKLSPINLRETAQVLTLRKSRPNIYTIGDLLLNGKIVHEDIVFNLLYK